MREEITRLMALQALDQALSEQQQALSRLSERTGQLRDIVEQSASELEGLKAEERQSALARREMEKALAEGETQIRTKRMRINAVRNDKELQAIGHEIESLKENNQRLEGELIGIMEAADPRAGRIKELDALATKKRAELKSAEKEIAAELEEIKLALTQRRIERDKLAAQIETGLRQRYETIFSRRGGQAVVLVKDGTCQGCRRSVPPQLYNEVLKCLQIHFCPSCQRILYFEALQTDPSDS